MFQNRGVALGGAVPNNMALNNNGINTTIQGNRIYGGAPNVPNVGLQNQVPQTSVGVDHLRLPERSMRSGRNFGGSDGAMNQNNVSPEQQYINLHVQRASNPNVEFPPIPQVD
jgi:hypothetical protein